MKSMGRGCIIGSFLLLLALALASCTPSETKALFSRGDALGVVLAEQTARIVGANKQVAIILPQWAAASTVGESLNAALKKQGITIVLTHSADVGDPMRRGSLGLKAADFFTVMEKAAKTGAVISLAGPPLLKPGEGAQLGSTHPPVLVVATTSLGNVMGLPGDPLQLGTLLEARVVQLAVVDADPDSKPDAQAGKVDAVHEVFAKNYRLLQRPD
jgi:hypothetical protein